MHHPSAKGLLMLKKLGGYRRNGWVVFTGICTLDVGVVDSIKSESAGSAAIDSSDER